MTRPVIFDEAAALRIVNTIRKVETGDRAERPLTFDAVPVSQQRKTFRIATFTGAWSIGATKTVTLKYQTNTPNTVVATNLFFPFPAPATATDCSIAKEGTAWFLVDVPFETATAVFASATNTSVFVASTAAQTVLAGITVSAVLNTTNCSIIVSTTQSTSSITVVGATATGIFMSATFTSSFVRFKVS
jgi:hypothetical protein